jgi:hypothetical protein
VRKAPTVLFLALALAGGLSSLHAQEHSGSIQGKVTDKAGKPIAGSTVYLASPSMLGTRIYVVGKTGNFNFPALPSGPYALSAERPGYESVVRDKIPLFTGMSFVVILELGPSELDVEVPAPGTPPAIDSVSGKRADVVDQSLIRLLPLARNLGDILSLAPGVLTAAVPAPAETFIHGGTVRDNATSFDGVDMTDMFTGGAVAAINIDQIEEIEIVTAGLPASHLRAGGGYLNIITKSGSNTLSGNLGFYVMNDGLNKDLWTPAQIQDLKTGPVSGDKGMFDGTFNLGGAFWPDRAWFYMSGRYARRTEVGNFIGPTTDTRGQQHTVYDWYRKDLWGFFKATARPIPEAKATIWINVGDTYQPVAEDPSPRLPFISTTILDHETNLTLNGVLDYNINPNAQAYVRAAYIKRNIPSRLQADALGLPYFIDAGSLYGPLSGAEYNSDIKRQRIQAEVSMRYFAVDFLGTTHTLTIGGDFQDSGTDMGWWRQDNMLWALDSRNPNGSYYGDRGLLSFWNCGSIQNSTLLGVKSDRFGMYAADSFMVGRRLSISLGLRFDYSWGWFPSGGKTVSGNPLSAFIGDAFVSPYLNAHYPNDFAAGYNPWGSFNTAEQPGVISWAVFSPRAGFAYDVLGNGKTILRGSYARIADELSQRYFTSLNPLYPRTFPITWLDANGDGQPDPQDEFLLSSMDYRMLSGSNYKSRVASDITAPITQEFSIGLDHELFRDFTLGLHYISKSQSNILEDVLYAPDTGEYWYSMSQPAAQKYWVPFTTTVPGTGSLPAQTVTLYARSLSAPLMYLQLRNVPELERKYRALELSFHKRISRGWQLAGSVVLSKMEGNIGTSADQTTALTAAGNSPNSFINAYGRLDSDRPLQIKLMGSLELPWGTWLSATFQYQSGRPWQRTAQVLPPAAWSSANNVEQVYYTVALDAPGSHRDTDWATLDLRLQKDWPMGRSGRLEMFVDINNVLGATASLVGLNDADRWLPAAAGAGQTGVRYLMPDYQVTSALYGRRTLRLGLKLNF